MVIKIEGMGCMHCVAKVRKAMEDIGATVVSCEIGTCEVESFANREMIRGAIEGAGFRVESISE